eukprot:8779766-Pyramimonas_sp.AAC.1
MCIVCHRLATPWVTAADGLHPDSLEAPGHPLDLLGTQLTFQPARVGARGAPIASHIGPPDLPPETTSYSPSWLIAELLAAWRHMTDAALASGRTADRGGCPIVVRDDARLGI